MAEALALTAGASCRFERTDNLRLVRQIVTTPVVWKNSIDDGCPPAGEFQPVDHPTVWYLLAYDGDDLLGLLSYVPENLITWKVHCALLPSTWGRSAEVLAGSFQWIWEQTPCERIEARVPSFNRLALRLAVNAGMIQEGIAKDSFLHNGRRWNEVFFGINRGDETCQQH